MGNQSEGGTHLVPGRAPDNGGGANPASRSVFSRWWVAPVAGTGAMLAACVCWFFLFILSGLAFDSCNSPVEQTCPAASHAVDLAMHLMVAALVLTVLQWPSAYWLRRARWAVSITPTAITLIACYVLFSMPAGQ